MPRLPGPGDVPPVSRRAFDVRRARASADDFGAAEAEAAGALAGTLGDRLRQAAEERDARVFAASSLAELLTRPEPDEVLPRPTPDPDPGLTPGPLPDPTPERPFWPRPHERAPADPEFMPEARGPGPIAVRSLRPAAGAAPHASAEETLARLDAAAAEAEARAPSEAARAQLSAELDEMRPWLAREAGRRKEAADLPRGHAALELGYAAVLGRAFARPDDYPLLRQLTGTLVAGLSGLQPAAEPVDAMARAHRLLAEETMSGWIEAGRLDRAEAALALAGKEMTATGAPAADTLPLTDAAAERFRVEIARCPRAGSGC